MMRSAVPLPPSTDAIELVAIASGIVAVSAPEASAIARSNPAILWKRLTTRSTNSGRSQNVSVRRTRPRSECGSCSAVVMWALGSGRRRARPRALSRGLVALHALAADPRLGGADRLLGGAHPPGRLPQARAGGGAHHRDREGHT